MLEIHTPIYITIPRKTKKDKTILLWNNRYRNAHYFTSNEVKRLFSLKVQDQVNWLSTFEEPICILYKYYLKRKWTDLNNIHSVISKFFPDILVDMDKLVDDNTEYINSSLEIFMWYDKDNPRCEIQIYNAKNISDLFPSIDQWLFKN